MNTEITLEMKGIFIYFYFFQVLTATLGCAKEKLKEDCIIFFNFQQVTYFGSYLN